MLGLTSLEVYKSIFRIAEDHNKFELHTDNFDEFSFIELKDNVEEILGLPDIFSKGLQHEILGPEIFETYRKLPIVKGQIDCFYMSLIEYTQSPNRDIEIYLRNSVGLVGDDIQLILKRYEKKCNTKEFSPCIYSNKDISEDLPRSF